MQCPPLSQFHIFVSLQLIHLRLVHCIYTVHRNMSHKNQNLISGPSYNTTTPHPRSVYWSISTSQNKIRFPSSNHVDHGPAHHSHKIYQIVKFTNNDKDELTVHMHTRLHLLNQKKRYASATYWTGNSIHHSYCCSLHATIQIMTSVSLAQSRARTKPTYSPAPHELPSMLEFPLAKLGSWGNNGHCFLVDKSRTLLAKHHPLNLVIPRRREDQMHRMISHFINTPPGEEFLPCWTSMRELLALPYMSGHKRDHLLSSALLFNSIQPSMRIRGWMTIIWNKYVKQEKQINVDA